MERKITSEPIPGFETLSPRVRMALEKGNVRDLDTFMTRSEREFFEIPRVGSRALKEIRVLRDTLRKARPDMVVEWRFCPACGGPAVKAPGQFGWHEHSCAKCHREWEACLCKPARRR